MSALLVTCHLLRCDIKENVNYYNYCLIEISKDFIYNRKLVKEKTKRKTINR